MVSAPPSDSIGPQSRPCSSSSPENARAPLNSQSEVRTVVVRVPLVAGREGSVGEGVRLVGSGIMDIAMGMLVYGCGNGKPVRQVSYRIAGISKPGIGSFR